MINNRLYAVEVKVRYGNYLLVVRASSKKKAGKMALNSFGNSSRYSLGDIKLLKLEGKEEVVIVGGMEE